MLDGKDFIHAFDAEPTLAIEEIGDVGLLEPSLLGQTEPGEFPCFDAAPENLAEIILQDFELHGREYSTGLWEGAKWGKNMAGAKSGDEDGRREFLE